MLEKGKTVNTENDNNELLGDDYDEPLYCIDCGQLLDRKDDKCSRCGAFQW